MKNIKDMIYSHVYANVTDLVNFSLEYCEEDNAPIAYSDIEGCAFVCPDSGSSKFTISKASNLPLESIYDKDYGETFYKCPVCKAEWDTPAEARACCVHKDALDEEVWQCQDCNAVFDNFSELIPCLPSDIEWWIVSKDLYTELRAGMEYVANVSGVYYWGNQETKVPLTENAILLAAMDVL